MYGSFLFNRRETIKSEDKIQSFQIGLDGLPYAIFGSNCYSFDSADLRAIADEVDRRNNVKVVEFPKHPIPTPVTRLCKGYGNQQTTGTSHVDLIDSINANIVAKGIFEPYADQILATIEYAKIIKRI